MIKPVSIQEPLLHYNWGDGCDGWTLVEEPSLSVKRERMPAGTAEALHYHQQAQQFFYILSGTATFEISGERIQVNEQQGLHIQAGLLHRILNETNQPLEFILSSQPSTKGDRINL
ncbi:cupin domain-containing protein [Sediminibacterium ginsengisoli]|uniref:Mannose-6-phosphate isomerase, cupin superfamily n=1 Tax=Sediminibacterium ginsengisoli TaxID=413434 RepID=A0A1T4LZ42_9BACT|nr:cupin domain-containing protein [Sediminibacterium ginsengisoli]SJZ60009.1 Mannose-6-phosphate isomerase, cupin superfamily [Sediminibacterium ginsengisoli]